MLEKIIIKNFMSYEDTEFEFHPGVNIICGPSNSGKTVLFRALRWIIENRPLGLSFRSDFAKKEEPTSVFVSIDDNYVKLEKDANGNAEYTVNGETFRKIKTEVPDAVQRALNFGELNLQDQLDQHFLITSPPGEVARVINNVIQIDQVDEWVSEATSRINKANAEIRTLEARAEQIQEGLRGFEYLPTFEKKLESLEKLWSCIETKQGEYESLSQLVSKIAFCQRKQERLSQVMPDEEKVKEAESLIPKIISHSKIIEAIYALKLCSENRKDLKVTIMLADPHVDKGEKLLLDIKAKKEEKSRLEALSNGLIRILSSKTRHDASLQSAKRSFFFLIKTMKTCPTCFTPIGDKAISRIEEELA